MLLEDIGFYTLNNERALNSSDTSPLWRCELLVTDKCNFKCPYCRGLAKSESSFENMIDTIDIWLDSGLKNVRFSGGEPTLYRGLEDLVRMCRNGGVGRIAISTNGSASLTTYLKLLIAGVNDFSISLDACCSQLNAEMTGSNNLEILNRITSNIEALSKLTYVSVGMVFTEKNVDKAIDNVLFADSLGVSDIRVIPSAQYNKAIISLKDLPLEILEKYPILKYRVNNVTNGRHVRGIPKGSNHKCLLALDDMAVFNGHHYPCIIYLREGGSPIGAMSDNVRAERANWIASHDPASDPICKNNCLDVCVYYNAVAATR